MIDLINIRIGDPGRKAKIGITAMSCNKRIEKDASPEAVLNKFFSLSVCRTIAVEDKAKHNAIVIAIL